MKECKVCSQIKEDDKFYKNKTKKDGLQTFCKECNKTAYGKWFTCTSCTKEFYVKHRNISNRKTRICQDCIINHLIKKNIERARPNILSEKGYIYLREAKEKHGYILGHRKIVASSIGRSLLKVEVVHHIDGNRINNNLDNLYLTDSKGHSKAHRSLELISYRLVEEGKIRFDKDNGTYLLVE